MKGHSLHKQSGFSTRAFSIFLVLLSVSAFILLAWYAYESGTAPHEPGEVPLIKADAKPYRTKPDEPGGMEIPHRDKTVYNAISGADVPPKVEKLLPDEEEPLAEEVTKGQSPDIDLAQTRQQILKEEDKEKRPVEALIQKKAPPQAEELLDEELKEADSLEKQMLKEESAPEKAKDDAKPSEEAEETHPQEKQAQPTPKAKEKKTLQEAPVKEVAPLAEPKEAAPVEKPAAKQKENAEVVSKTSANLTPHRVQLGAYKSREEAEESWHKIVKAQSNLLKEKGHTIERADLGAKGIFYRLQLVPFASRDEANALCKELKANKQGCFVVKR